MIDLGDVHPLTIDVTDADGNPANATSVALTITLPDLTTATPAVSNPTTGRYTCDYPTTQAGRHVVRWVATGTNAGSHSEVFNVAPASPGPIIGLNETKKHLNMSLIKTVDDEELRDVIVAATPVVEDVVGPVVVRSFTDVDSHGGSLLALDNPPVVSLTSIVSVLTGGTTYDVADMDVDHEAGIVRRLDGGRFSGPLRIVYTAGRAVVPHNILQGTKEIVAHAWRTQRGQLGRTGFGGDEDLLPTPSGFLVPRRAMEWLRPQAKGPMVA